MTELTVPEQTLPEPSDTHTFAMTLDVETQNEMLAAYAERRRNFRDRLKEQMKEGVHFGYPPGCEPRLSDDGTHFWLSSKGGGKWVPVSQWQSKPSLYKAGAQFVLDFCRVVARFEIDMQAWEQMGKPDKTFVVKCLLYPRGAIPTDDKLISQGYGARVVGNKGMDINATIKMAEKAAAVDAVLNAWGLSDLFTQDTEDPGAGNPPPTDDEKKNRQWYERNLVAIKEKGATQDKETLQKTEKMITSRFTDGKLTDEECRELLDAVNVFLAKLQT